MASVFRRPSYRWGVTCLSRIEFKKKFPTAHRIANKRGVLEAIWRISHDNEKKSTRTWYKAHEIIEEAKKFDYVQDFAEANPKAYRAAKRKRNLIYKL